MVKSVIFNNFFFFKSKENLNWFVHTKVLYETFVEHVYD